MRVGPEGRHYTWHDDWAQLPDDERRHRGWAHNALVVTRDGKVVGIHPADGQVVVLEPDGTVVRSVECGLVEGHGMCLVEEEEDGQEYVWIADCGLKVVPVADSQYGYEAHAPDPNGRVIKVRIGDGTVVHELPIPNHDLYRDSGYLPTCVAVDPEGCVWVGDGYGASLLHRFDPDGRLLLTLTGEESAAGRLDCPHGMLVDRRHTEAELYVADRENRRLVVFSLDGAFQRVVADGELERPCSLATHGDLLVVAELSARVALLDLNDRLIGSIGDNGDVTGEPGWPNAIVDGKIARQTSLTVGKFNSPHGIAVDGHGNLYVTEWLVGGRYTKLEPESD